MTGSFLGVNARFAPRNFSQPGVRIALACREFPSSHVAGNVYDLVKKVLEKFGISRESVSAVVTDNGSKMVCAFKEYVAGACELAEYEKNEATLRELEVELLQTYTVDGYNCLDAQDVAAIQVRH